ncbi:MAG: AAA family ATPase [Candidatus Methanofastidiosia archaeon]
MTIKKIKVTNFKSFKNMEIELGDLNVLIGPNASGKSNFVEIFRFLRDIATHGLDNAVSLQGGIDFLRNVKIGSSEGFSMQITYDSKSMSAIGVRGRSIGVKTLEMIYEFCITSTEEGDLEISRDDLTATYDFFRLPDNWPHENTETLQENLGSGRIKLSNVEGKIEMNLDLPERDSIRDIFPLFLTEIKMPARALFLETPFFETIPPFGNLFDDISLYDFDPKLPKRGAPITGKMELDDNGTNLAIVLKNILDNKEKKRKFVNLLKDVLPFLDELEVEKFMDKSLILKASEIYAPNYFPASFLSDGTITITALILVLYFEQKPIIIVEEPERNIHPFLISKVMGMFKEASKKKQIIITTHNPEIVRFADLKDILLISREKEGFSVVSRPGEKKGVKTFLEHEIGVEELYIQNLLGV